MCKYRWIVFDADGTLFDYDRAELSALVQTLEQYGVVFDSRIHQTYVEINARLWAEFELGRVSSMRLRVERFEELADAIGVDIDATLFSRDYLSNLGADASLLPDAYDVVERLSPNFGLVLATNGIKEVQRSRFSASMLEPYFHDVVISDEIGVAKPEPGFFTEMFSRMNCPEKSEVLIVGDSLSSDIAGGSNFGINTCWFNPKRHPNDTSVEPTFEIRALLDVIKITGSR